MATEPTDEDRARWAEQDRIAGPPPNRGQQEPKTGGYICGVTGREDCPTDRTEQRECPRC